MEHYYPKKSILTWILWCALISAVATGAVYGWYFYDKPVFNPTTQNPAEPTSKPTPKQPYIKVNSPGGGETWKVGETHTITWTSRDVKNVKISFVTSTDVPGEDLSIQIANVSAADGFYVWNIADIISGNVYLPDPQEITVKMLVSDNDSLVADYSGYIKVIK